MTRSSRQIKCHGQKTKQKIQRGTNDILQELLVAEATGTAPLTPNHIVERRRRHRMDGPTSVEQLPSAWSSRPVEKDNNSVDSSGTGQRQKESRTIGAEDRSGKSSCSLGLLLRASDEEMTAADTLCRLQVLAGMSLSIAEDDTRG
jgi:hypothetical protein